MLRIFLAIDIANPQRKILAEHQGRWKSVKADVKWMPPSNIHLTLSFLGNIHTRYLQDIVDACNRACARQHEFKLSLNKTGAFPCLENPRVLWVSIKGHVESLCELQGRIKTELEQGRFPFSGEKRPFLPHLTVGRIRSSRNMVGFTELFAKDKVPAAPFDVHEVVIYKSVLTRKGTLYEPIAKSPLVRL